MRTAGALIAGMFAGLLAGLLLTEPAARLLGHDGAGAVLLGLIAPALAVVGAIVGVVAERRTR